MNDGSLGKHPQHTQRTLSRAHHPPATRWCSMIIPGLIRRGDLCHRIEVRHESRVPGIELIPMLIQARSRVECSNITQPLVLYLIAYHQISVNFIRFLTTPNTLLAHSSLFIVIITNIVIIMIIIDLIISSSSSSLLSSLA